MSENGVPPLNPTAVPITNPITTEVRRTISPYDLTAADNPGAVISHPLLKGSNYDEWAIGLKTALSSRKKFGFLDGSIPRPADGSSDLDDWWTIQALLVSWIKMTIDPALRSSISHRDVAKDLWDHLKKRFSVTNGPRIQQLKAELACCKQRGLAIEAYYGKMNRIWDNMAQYRPLRVCKCGKCECDLGTLHEQDRETEKVHEFLSGLDEKYQTVRSALVSRTPIQSLEEVYNVVRQEEVLKTTSSPVEVTPEVTAYAAQSRERTSYSRSDEAEKCKHCHRGHPSDRCFAVIGYPEWWGDRPKTRTLQSRGRGGVSSFGGRGRGVNYANAVHVPQLPPPEQANHVFTDKDRDGVHGLSDAQWRTLVSLLNAGSNGTNTEKLSGMYSSPSWILDTGASHHLTGSLHILTDIREMDPVLVILADGRERISVTEGTVALGPNLILKSVFYVEELKSDLISVGQLMDENNCVVQLADRFLVIQDRVSRTVIGAGKRESGTFRFCRTESVAAVTTRDDKAYELWHHRLGHPSAKVVGLLKHVDVSVVSESFNKACDVCFRAKQTRSPFPTSINKTKQVFELIHSDLWGPYRTPSHSGARYFLTIVDDFSRTVWLYLLTDKTEAPVHLKNFIAMAACQFQSKVQCLRSDNGTEFMSLTSYFREQGIRHETSCVGTPQQNGKAERKHRHVLNVARALMFQAKMPIEFWGECILTAGYLINRTPSSALNGLTPYEMLHNKAPDYAHLRVFGSLCYAHNQGHKGDKFVSRSRKCAFVGYPYGKKGWRLYDLEKKQFFVSRDVVFCENEFPFVAAATENLSHGLDEEGGLWAPIGPNLIEEEVGPPARVTPSPLPNPTTNFSPPSSPTTPATSIDSDHLNPPSPVPNPTPAESSTPQDSPEPPPEPELLGRGQRRKTQSVTLRNFVINTAQSKLLSSPSGGKSTYPISNYVNCHRFSQTHQAYLVAITENVEPKSFKTAMQFKVWTKAMGNEVTALEENGTWELVDLPAGKRAIGCKWVYKIKYNSDGTIERHKARLVALGNRQIEGEDYGETFAPVARMGTVRLFLKVAAGNNWPVYQMDVHNAFLHGDLAEEVYMKPPPGFLAEGDQKVCRLKKSIYGLKQAPRCWFEKLTKALRAYGFQQSLADYSLFNLDKNGVKINLLIYVDDMILTGNSEQALKVFKAYLSSCFKMKDLGFLKYFLGIEVSRNKSGFYLSQRKYTMDILAETGMLGAKPASFPLEQHHRLALSTSAYLIDPTPYRRLVGRLIYLGATRPDLAFSVHVLAQFMQQPRDDHWQSALRVVRYLKGSPGQGILLDSDNTFQVSGWCDAGYASCPLTRRSITGYFVQLGQSPVSWKTKKQDTVSKSSSEAEYRAMSFLKDELVSIKSVLRSLGVVHDQPMGMYCDSKSAIYISTNPVFHERTKHVETDCHSVREQIQNGTITPHHVSTTQQLADIFTKPLGRKSFEFFRTKLGILDLHAPA
ncbi:unnamed protein product [Microthlaspi erraticum]|uniref:Integrase catalytic domain-containing protein n=1 Tax=Microthlaspi erraticum TaxID=1685480 RepID=A0A6D2KM48_9BRAS|nr:unnamed protein product [Microthlaspi erraticum]CAA7055570.1 unnamed protein product [Microthlaspi erraticum]